ncbi:hypothetical protein DMH08_21175 [Actinomadura sp. WAC 06369]|nr:hypothetical protein DMH08_21175 [Actinomadura sp. WAC 06369]
MTTFLVPAAARADVTDVNLSVAFDRLSADRVATVTLEAKSASGITGVEAAVEQLANEEWTPIATMPLARTGGTANDGTWTAEYRTDIEAHPGGTRFVAEIASADGTTLTTEAKYIDNCYQLTMTDLTSSPEVIDADTPVTVEGRVLVQRTRDAEPEPAPDVAVTTSGSSVRTRADGSFTYTTGYTEDAVRPKAGREPELCTVMGAAPEPEIEKQSVKLSGRIVTPMPVEAGSTVVVEGRLERNGADGLVPVPGAVVSGQVVSGPFSRAGRSVYTSEDGGFRLSLPVEEAGRLSLDSEENDLLESGLTDAGALSIGGDSRIVGFDMKPSPVGYHEMIHATGRLMAGSEPIADAQVRLEYADTTYAWWDTASYVRTNSEGYFDVQSPRTLQDGYWRVHYVGSGGKTLAMSDVRHVEVKYGTRLDGYTATAGAGGAVTIQGELVRLKDGEEPASGLPVYVYFMADGQSTWEFQGTTEAGTDGTFGKQFKTDKNGYWTAAFWGDDDHIRSNAPIAHVKVLGKYTTEFAEFGASPSPVAAGEPITLKGLLTRSVDGGAAEAAPGKPVYVYFLPAGATEWVEKAVVQTGADGRFEKAFAAEEDGYWTAWFFGDEGHLSVNSGSEHVDVR